MRPELALPRHASLTERIVPAWRMPLLRLALAWAAILLLFAPTVAEMAAQYWDSSTYNHIILVPAILGWLVALRIKELARLEPEAWWPGLLWVAGASLVWLVGTLSGVATASHLGLVLMLQGAVLALLGPRVAAALLFPLAYAFFLVPVGDELVPTLQMITADQVIALTHASGIPAEINGVFIDTPAGLFEVAEACSGVKFLVAMLALGTLVSHLCFRSWVRRAAFMALAIALPILANSVRAWGTIYIAQSQGVEFAAGFDHIFYGWIFFAIVMGLLLTAGWKFFDRSPDDSFVDVEALRNSAVLDRLTAFAMKGWTAFAILIAILVGALGWSSAAHAIEADLPERIAFPAVAGWEAVDYAPQHWWEPRAEGADHRLLGRFRNAQGQEVDVFFALYAAQDNGREADGFGQGALVPDSEWRWLKPGPALGDGISEVLQGNNRQLRTAVTWYRHGAMFGGNRVRLKLATLADRIALKEQPTSALIVSSEGPDGFAAIDAWVYDAGPLYGWMDRAAQTP